MTMASANTEVMRYARKLGWKSSEGRRHVVLEHPITGARLVVSRSCQIAPHNVRNYLAQLRRGASETHTDNNKGDTQP
mgnify:CR=1 FL=1